MLFSRKNKTNNEELNYDMIMLPQNFSLKSEFWDSPAEAKIYNILKSYIDEYYIIMPHVAFTDIFSINTSNIVSESEAKKILDVISKYHFDFVIYDKNFLPVLFIEINGSVHINKKKIDTFKRQLISSFSYNGLQLLEIDLFEKISDDELKVLVEKSLYGNITSRNKFPAYCWQCRSLMELKQNRTTKEFFYLCPNCKSKTNSAKNKTIGISKIPYLLKKLS